MSKRNVLGFIVVTGRGPLWEENRKSSRAYRGVLYHGKSVTMFATRAQAKAAIVRSQRYAIENELPWEEDYRVKSVESHVGGPAT